MFIVGIVIAVIAVIVAAVLWIGMDSIIGAISSLIIGAIVFATAPCVGLSLFR